MDLTLLTLLFLLAAGFAAGFINTAIGSGSLLTFPALLLVGLPPVTANASNTVGLSIGNIMGAVGYRQELRAAKHIATPLLLVTVPSATLGAIALLMLPPQAFSNIAPWLIGVGTALVLLQPLFAQVAHRDPQGKRAQASRLKLAIAIPLTAITGAYGGYFGAAQGVLIVGILGSLFRESTHTINALKNLLQTAAGLAATVVFVASGTVHWLAIATLATSSTAGALVGVRAGRRLPPWVFRTFVAAMGVASIAMLTSP